MLHRRQFLCHSVGVDGGQAGIEQRVLGAISTTLLALLNQGDHMVASADIYGGTYGLLTEEFPRFGISTTMADMRDASSYESAIQENTKILYIETLTNPVLKVCDIEAMQRLPSATTSCSSSTTRLPRPGVANR